MILFNEIVEILALLVENVTAKNLANDTWIGTMSIRRDSLWCMIDHLECVLEKALHCIHISLLLSSKFGAIPGSHHDQSHERGSTSSHALFCMFHRHASR